MRQLRKLSVFLCYSLISCVLLMSPVSATVTPYVSFQGKLTNPDGTNVADTSYSVTFSIYSVSSGGSAVWTETKSITTSAGLFQTNLGDTTALPGSVNFNSTALYLGVKVGSDAEMTPRVQLTAVPQAFNADNLDGIDSTGFIQLSPGSQQTGNINISGSITSGAINTNTFSATALTFGAASTATIQSAASQALTITANAASTWSTSSGTLTLQSGSGTVSLGSSTVLTSTGALAINSGAATALTVDSGTTGALNLGTSSNAKTIIIGNTTGATTVATLVGGSTNAFSVQGASSAIFFQIDSTNSRIYIGNPTADSSAALFVLDARNVSGETSAPAVTGVNGGEYYNSADNKFRCYENSAWKNCINGDAYVFSTVYGATAATAAKAAAATILVSPLYVSGQITVNKLVIDVTTLLGAAGDVGIYDSTGALVLNGGNSSVTTAAGVKSITPTQTNKTLQPGQYYAAVTWNSTTGAVLGSTVAGAGMISRTGSIAAGGGLVLPSTITPSGITNGTALYAISINN
ncbi:MAG TPA: hypothetical protein VLH38_01680 [Patescibacteria group bacterium]|nr:hypothetical protein [Patescibacteria group bacterium]